MSFRTIFQKINNGYLFLFSFLIVFVVTPLFQKGVFGDGLMYLTVAFNRYKEYGSFWRQHYSETSMSFFCEQPPLYFESLGWFYKLFGGAEIAEKFFTLTLALLTIFLLGRIWNKLTAQKNKGLAWLPSMLLFCVPVFAWAFCNQVIETMVVPAALGAFYLLLVFMDSLGIKKLFSFIGFCATLLVLFLIKGIQSDFLAAALFLAAVSARAKEFGKIVIQGVLMLLFFGGLFTLVFLLNENAHYWLMSYFDKRIVATFNDTGATAAHHIDIVTRYFSELLPVLGFFILVSLYLSVAKKYPVRKQLKNFASNKKALWLVLISLSASLPMAVTLEQRGFYLSPAFPFAILALCLYYRKYLFLLFGRLARKREKMWFVMAGIVLASSIIFFIFNREGYKRDEGTIRDVAEMKKIFASGEIIGINPSTWNTFSLHSYLNKANDNSLFVTDTARFFIQEKENREQIPGNYDKMNIATSAVDVYSRREYPNK